MIEFGSINLKNRLATRSIDKHISFTSLRNNKSIYITMGALHVVNWILPWVVVAYLLLVYFGIGVDFITSTSYLAYS